MSGTSEKIKTLQREISHMEMRQKCEWCFWLVPAAFLSRETFDFSQEIVVLCLYVLVCRRCEGRAVCPLHDIVCRRVVTPNVAKCVRDLPHSGSQPRGLHREREQVLLRRHTRTSETRCLPQFCQDRTDGGAVARSLDASEALHLFVASSSVVHREHIQLFFLFEHVLVDALRRKRNFKSIREAPTNARFNSILKTAKLGERLRYFDMG
mmetsp:Transcript_46285/g.78775  ORF Transcript_46285/g.78775 Transcript_46285/m.78775 type:complete len:209 (-) Transcript_46285:445-1071(-)